MKKAIILAAGTGKRLGELTKDIPKCLLPIEDKTLIDYSLMSLYKNKCEKVFFVTGFADNKLKEHLDKKWKGKFSFEFIFNANYKDFNNIYSAYLASDIWDDETILLNSDIIYHPDILNKLKEKFFNSYLIVDNTKPLVEEDMKVKINNKGELTKINKNLELETSYGEYIGITYLRGNERVKFLESVENNVKNKNLDLYYEDALDQILNNVSVLPLSTFGKPWTEVDTKEDYEKAKNLAKEMRKVTIP